jgi:ring-1,2-phenylacetyl-CoA epoxidase subunit PaaD
MSCVTALDREALRQRAFEAVAAVCDPEVPVLTIADLGILHDVSVGDDGKVRVTILPTYIGCPAIGAIQLAVQAALAEAGFTAVEVKLSYTPAWSTDLMSEEAREKLRAAGIAPPTPGAGKSALFAADEPASCPRCGSHATEKIAQFGATACKALWRCTSCREPFEYFKCI